MKVKIKIEILIKTMLLLMIAVKAGSINEDAVPEIDQTSSEEDSQPADTTDSDLKHLFTYDNVMYYGTRKAVKVKNCHNDTTCERHTYLADKSYDLTKLEEAVLNPNSERAEGVNAASMSADSASGSGDSASNGPELTSSDSQNDVAPVQYLEILDPNNANNELFTYSVCKYNITDDYFKDIDLDQGNCQL